MTPGRACVRRTSPHSAAADGPIAIDTQRDFSVIPSGLISATPVGSVAGEPTLTSVQDESTEAPFVALSHTRPVPLAGAVYLTVIVADAPGARVGLLVLSACSTNPALAVCTRL